jgi:uncharacterized protein (TIGR02246 family)
MQKTHLIPVIALAMLAGCAAPPVTDATPTGAQPITAEDRTAIEANSKLFEEAFLAGDEEKLGPLYTEDAILYGPDEPAVTGREAIVKSFSTFPPMKSGTLDIQEIEGYGDLAYVRGVATFTMTGPDGKDMVLVGKYLEIHRKQADGSWLMSRDIFNFDSPAR